MLFRLILLGFLWVAIALAVEAFFGGGAGGLLFVGGLLWFVGSVVVCFLKGRWIAGGIGVSVVVLAFLTRDVGDAGIVLVPFLLAGLLVPVFRAAIEAKPGSQWARRFPTAKT